VALQLAAEDDQPARRGTYLAPLLRLHRQCAINSPLDVMAIVESLVKPLQTTGAVRAPRAEAAAALAADVQRDANCYGLAAKLTLEIARPSVTPAGRWDGQTTYVRFSPALTAGVALAVVRHVVLAGAEHQVYALTAQECQQAVYLGADLAKVTGSSSLGAFVELTSGRGVGRSRYDASRIDTARITVLGAIGGEPCT
jgi:hypothetical protein